MKINRKWGASGSFHAATALSGLIFALSGASCAGSSGISSVPDMSVTGLSVPPLGVGSDTVYLIWDRPQSFSPITDYVLYINGTVRIETARSNFERINPRESLFRNAFYTYYSSDRTGIEMVQTAVCSYYADGLYPETSYTFRVAAVDDHGKEICSSSELTVKTGSAVSSSSILDIRTFGAVSGKQPADISSNTAAIQHAIDSCPSGGTVVIPQGVFVTGSLHLKSHMTFRIDGTLLASPSAGDFEYGFLLYPYYTDRRYYGVLNADGAEDIRIIGNGTIDGNGWHLVDEYEEDGDGEELPRFVHSGFRTVETDGVLAASCVRSYLERNGTDFEHATENELRSAYATRSTLVILRNVRGLLISGVTFTNPANHTVNILDSSDISVTGISVLSYDANNGDGIGLICSQNAVIWNNFIDTGDDSIVFSAGVGAAAAASGEQGVSDVHIFGNYIHHGHGGIAFGSHTALGIRRVVIEDTLFSHTDMPFRCKSAPVNGGEVTDVVFRNNAVAEAVQAFVLTTEYSDPGTVSPYGAAETPAVFHDISVRNCTVYGVKDNTICIIASKGNPHHDLLFENILFAAVGRSGIYTRSGGWESINGCTDSEFKDVRTVSYDTSAVKNKCNHAWTNVVNCTKLHFTGATRQQEVFHD